LTKRRKKKEREKGFVLVGILFSFSTLKSNVTEKIGGKKIFLFPNIF